MISQSTSRKKVIGIDEVTIESDVLREGFSHLRENRGYVKEVKRARLPHSPEVPELIFLYGDYVTQRIPTGMSLTRHLLLNFMYSSVEDLRKGFPQGPHPERFKPLLGLHDGAYHGNLFSDIQHSEMINAVAPHQFSLAYASLWNPLADMQYEREFGR